MVCQSCKLVHIIITIIINMLMNKEWLSINIITTTIIKLLNKSQPDIKGAK
jgi:hypothetical protein